jgi:membrane protein YdbS with pleckstrin-like domain
MKPKPGYQTSEFWLTFVKLLLSPVLLLLVAYQVVTQPEAELWKALVLAILDGVASAGAVAMYTHGRARVKVASLR